MNAIGMPCTQDMISQHSSPCFTPYFSNPIVWCSLSLGSRQTHPCSPGHPLWARCCIKDTTRRFREGALIIPNLHLEWSWLHPRLLLTSWGVSYLVKEDDQVRRISLASWTPVVWILPTRALSPTLGSSWLTTEITSSSFPPQATQQAFLCLYSLHLSVVNLWGDSGSMLFKRRLLKSCWGVAT